MTEERNKRQYDKETFSDDNNGWQEWKHYVLDSIKTAKDDIDQLAKNRHNCQLWCTQEITKLKVKSSVWGAISGFVISIILSIVVSISAGYLTKNVDLTKEDKKIIKQEKQINRLEHRIKDLEDKDEK